MNQGDGTDKAMTIIIVHGPTFRSVRSVSVFFFRREKAKRGGFGLIGILKNNYLAHKIHQTIFYYIHNSFVIFIP